MEELIRLSVSGRESFGQEEVKEIAVALAKESETPGGPPSLQET